MKYLLMMDAKSLDINVVLSCRVLKQLILYKINILSFETQFTNHKLIHVTCKHKLFVYLFRKYFHSSFQLLSYTNSGLKSIFAS